MTGRPCPNQWALAKHLVSVVGAAFAVLASQSASAAIDDIAAGYAATCIVVDGGVRCWGSGGSAVGASDGQSTAPVQMIAASSGATRVAVGRDHACAVVAGGLVCWGNQTAGALGNGATSGYTTPVQSVSAGAGIPAVAAGDSFTCVLQGGGVRCTGTNTMGQLGDNTAASRSAFGDVTGMGSGTGYVALAAGGCHACAATSASGGLYCWGQNTYGQLFRNSPTTAFLPFQADLSAPVSAVRAGTSASCGLLADTSVWCYGYAASGQLGNGLLVQTLAPAISSGASDVSLGLGHACAIVNGGIQCWGNNLSLSILGNDVTGGIQPSPIQVPTFPAGSGATRVAAATAHTCAIVNGGVRCWGSDGSSRLGFFFDVPVNVSRFGPGNGTVTSQGGEVNCGGICRAWFVYNSNVVLTATPTAGATLLRWDGVTCTEGNTGPTCSFALDLPSFGQANVRVIFGKPMLNIDNSAAATAADPATDGILLLRYLLGFRGATLIANARGSAGASPLRDATEIEAYLAANLGALDVDRDGQTLALTDGLMILRRLLGLDGAAVTAGVNRGPNSDADVLTWIDALKP